MLIGIVVASIIAYLTALVTIREKQIYQQIVFSFDLYYRDDIYRGNGYITSYLFFGVFFLDCYKYE